MLTFLFVYICVSFCSCAFITFDSYESTSRAINEVRLEFNYLEIILINVSLGVYTNILQFLDG